MRQPRDWRPAGAFKAREERALGRHAISRLRIVERRDQLRHLRVILADFDGDCALRHGGQDLVGLDRRRDAVRHAEPVKPRAGEQRRVGDAFGKLAQPRLHVAAEAHDLEIRPYTLHLRLTPEARRSDDGPLRQVRQRGVLEGNEGIAHVFARQRRADHETGWQFGLHVLHGMHGKVDLARDQRFLDLLGKEPLSANLRQRPVLDGIARGLVDADLDRLLGKAMGSGKARPHFVGLSERQGRTASADAEGASLQVEGSRC